MKKDGVKSTKAQTKSVVKQRVMYVCKMRNIRSIRQLHSILNAKGMDRYQDEDGYPTFWNCLDQGRINESVLNMIAVELNCNVRYLEGKYNVTLSDIGFSNSSKYRKYLARNGFYVDQEGYIFSDYQTADAADKLMNAQSLFADFMRAYVPLLSFIDGSGKTVTFADYLTEVYEDMSRFDTPEDHKDPEDFTIDKYNFSPEFYAFSKTIIEEMKKTHSRSKNRGDRSLL